MTGKTPPQHTAGQLQWHSVDHSFAIQKGPRRSTACPRAKIFVTGQSAHYFPPADSPYLANPAYDCAPWPTCSPTLALRTSNCASTAPKSRSAARKPAAPHSSPARRTFVSGKKKQNTGKATVISDDKGRLLWCGAVRPGRMHDVTALRTEGIEDLLQQYPDVIAQVDSGYQGLARDYPDQVSTPPKKPAKTADDTQRVAYETTRHAQSSARICVEHTIAEQKQWRPLQRYIGHRDHFEDTILAIAGLVSDRAAEP